MGLVDVHAHLTHPRLRTSHQGIISRAIAAGISSIVCNGVHPQDNEAVLALAAQSPIIRPALGFYPVEVVLVDMLRAGVPYPRDDDYTCTAEEGVKWLDAHVDHAFAIGEIGLDGYWVPEQFWAQQEKVFCDLVRLAMAADKPIIIHTRKRERRTLELLQELGATRVNWHCFGGKVKWAQEIAAMGHYFSIPANARRSESFTRMLQVLPRDRILLETDCPYLGPVRDQDSEPAHVRGTAEYAAELWHTSFDAVVQQIEHNYADLFRVAA